MFNSQPDGEGVDHHLFSLVVGLLQFESIINTVEILIYTNNPCIQNLIIIKLNRERSLFLAENLRKTRDPKMSTMPGNTKKMVSRQQAYER